MKELPQLTSHIMKKNTQKRLHAMNIQIERNRFLYLKHVDWTKIPTPEIDKVIDRGIKDNGA